MLKRQRQCRPARGRRYRGDPGIGLLLGPLVLVSLGLSGAWIGNLTALEPFRPVFVGAALIALFFAYRRIFRPAGECEPGRSLCATAGRSAPIRSCLGSWPPWWWSRSPFPYIAPRFY